MTGAQLARHMALAVVIGGVIYLLSGIFGFVFPALGGGNLSAAIDLSYALEDLIPILALLTLALLLVHGLQRWRGRRAHRLMIGSTYGLAGATIASTGALHGLHLSFTGV